MNCNWNRIKRANEEADRINEAIKRNRWKDVLKAVEHWPELLFWERLEANMGGNLFLNIWEEDRWMGRECVRILLKTPELLKKVPICNYGYSTFSVGRKDYSVHGPLMGLLAGAGERELMKEALDAGLDPDGWIDGGWYEGTDGLYFFGGDPDCEITGTSIHQTYRTFGDGVVTPLLIAIFREDVEMVKLLIQYGATFLPESELCQEYLKDCSSWTIRDMLKKAYGGGER